jgi:hypothetical protein
MTGDVEHSIGVGIAVGQPLRLDGMLTSESAYGSRAWRIGVDVAIAFGHYGVAVARGSSLNDLGATYRIGLEAGSRR